MENPLLRLNGTAIEQQQNSNRTATATEQQQNSNRTSIEYQQNITKHQGEKTT